MNFKQEAFFTHDRLCYKANISSQEDWWKTKYDSLSHSRYAYAKVTTVGNTKKYARRIVDSPIMSYIDMRHCVTCITQQTLLWLKHAMHGSSIARYKIETAKVDRSGPISTARILHVMSLVDIEQDSSTQETVYALQQRSKLGADVILSRTKMAMQPDLVLITWIDPYSPGLSGDMDERSHKKPRSRCKTFCNVKPGAISWSIHGKSLSAPSNRKSPAPRNPVATVIGTLAVISPAMLRACWPNMLQQWAFYW